MVLSVIITIPLSRLSNQEVISIFINELILTHFRNYKKTKVVFPKGLIILHGSNGQGKTNLLEAVSLLSTGHSHRTIRDRDTIGWSSGIEPIPYTRIEARLSNEAIETRLEMVLQISRNLNSLDISSLGTKYGPSDLTGGRLQKALKINNVRQKQAYASQILKVVVTGPEEVSLISGPPSERRLFLDESISQTNQKFSLIYKKYQKVLRQRNSLLKQLRQTNALRTSELDIWDAELIDLGSYILEERITLLKSIQPQAKKAYKYLTGELLPLTLSYQGSVLPESNPSIADIKLSLSNQLKSNWGRDLATATTSAGPHRDDFKTLVNDVDLGIYGSRGQQRMVSIALFLAEASYIHEITSQKPILLFDDPLSELDISHREKFLEYGTSLGEQLFLTTAEINLIPIPFRQKGVLYKVEDGQVLTQDEHNRLVD